MGRLKRKKLSRRQKVGLPPGTITPHGRENGGQTTFYLTRYSSSQYFTQSYKSIEEVQAHLRIESGSVLWLHIDSLRDQKTMEHLGQIFHIHPLTLEDAVNSQHRPKLEVFDDYLHFVIKALSFDSSSRLIYEDQINIILGHGFVISLSDAANCYFQTIFNRLSVGRGIIRNMRADYLAYCLLDYVIDNYFILYENFDAVVEELENTVLNPTSRADIHSLYEVKRQGLALRKILGPVKEMVSSIRREKSPLIGQEVETYFRDLFDHISEVNDSFDALRVSLINLVDVSYANSAEKTNSVMKVLAVISAIFLPLNFIVGIFGMNFEKMPGLHLESGFYVALGLNFLIAVSLATFFKIKAWW